MEVTHILVKAEWDPEASVWVAESDDVPGLITEAESSEALLAKLRVLIPELLVENGCTFSKNHIDLTIQYYREDKTVLHIAA
jgi:hypothetical protein